MKTLGMRSRGRIDLVAEVFNATSASNKNFANDSISVSVNRRLELRLERPDSGSDD